MPVVTNLLLPDSMLAITVRFRPYINTQSPDGWPWLYCHLFQRSLAFKPSIGHVRRSIPRIGIRGCLYVFVYSKYINYIGCWMCPVLPNQLRQCIYIWWILVELHHDVPSLLLITVTFGVHNLFLPIYPLYGRRGRIRTCITCAQVKIVSANCRHTRPLIVPPGFRSQPVSRCCRYLSYNHSIVAGLVHLAALSH